MFRYTKINDNCFEGHLEVKKYTHNTVKKVLPEIKKLAKINNYPDVWTCLPKRKQRLAEHFGFRLIRNDLTKEGLFAVMLLETKLCFQNK
jgi:hypothetical protein